MYLALDRVFAKPTVLNAVYKMLIDVYVQTPLLMIPTFYLITCLMRGRTVSDTLSKLRREWPEAAFGSALFWTPICLLNFAYVPQHSRTVVVALCSFVHKTWMSWLSNRDECAVQ